ncbi:MAG: prepilin-type N-terminal cleavage/methylation domain-containing protein [Thermoanaerobaculia bacterium]
MTNRVAIHPTRARQGGFSLVELLVALAILVLILVGVLQLFDMHSRIARTQTNVADMQQSLRVSQNEMIKLVRMAGRGMLPAAHTTLTKPGADEKLLPNGISVEVLPNVADGTQMGGNDVVPGTDVLIIRGVISSPIYLVDTVQTANFVFNDTNGDEIPDNGVIKNIRSTPKVDRLPIDGSPLKKAIEDSKAATPVLASLVLVSPVSDGIYAVVEIDPATSNWPAADYPGESDPTGAWSADVGFKSSAGTLTADYAKLSPKGAFPKELRTIAYLAPLDEYRFYVREEYAIPADTTSELMPALSVARYFPGSNTVRPGEGSVDIADNILDLQVTLGIDLDQDGVINPEADPADPANDEWLFNHDSETTDLDATKTTWQDRLLYYLRVNTLARTDRPDLDFVSEPLDLIEDRDWNEPAVPGSDQARRERMHRRRLMQTTIDLRNLS